MGAAFSGFIGRIAKDIVCLVKVLILVLINFIVSIPGVDIVTTIWLNIFAYLLVMVPRILVSLFLFTCVAIVAFIDVTLGQIAFGGNSSIGRALAGLFRMTNTCLSDPRAWYINKRWHKGNFHSKLMGFFPCMAPCGGVYQPQMFGVLCGIAPRDAPPFCPQAAVTRATEGISTPQTRSTSKTDEACSSLPIDGIQNDLIFAACHQTSQFTSKGMRSACYDMFCRNPSSEEEFLMCSQTVPGDVSLENVAVSTLWNAPIVLMLGIILLLTSRNMFHSAGIP